MTSTPAFDGPRLVKADEWRASRLLSEACFGGGDGVPEAPGQPAPPESSPPRRPPGETYLIAAGGRPVSQISLFFTPLTLYGARVRTGSIGGVCTHPEFRGYGLASRLMQHCTQRLAKGGARLMIISGGRGLYRRLGSVPMGKFASFTLRPADSFSDWPPVRLRPARPDDAAACSRFYHSEPVHFTRAIGRYAGRFQDHPTGFHAEDWIVEMEYQPAAYLLLNVPWDAMDEPGMPVRDVFEYAGSRLALASALASAARQGGIRQLQALIPWQDFDLVRLLARSHGEPSWTALPDHTVRVINFPGLMADLRLYIQARLSPALRRGLRFEQSGPLLGGQGDDRCAITRGHDRLELDGADMTRLVMGDPGGQAPPASGALVEIIAALFPLPAFFAGLDYH